MNSYRPSIASNSFVGTFVSKPSNPIYTSKPNRTMSDKSSLDDGNDSSETNKAADQKQSDDDDIPMPPKDGEANSILERDGRES